MGFLDKVKESLNKMKEGSKNFAETTKRINSPNYYGNVNRHVKDGDFPFSSYINLENGKFVIFSTSSEDYMFTNEDLDGKINEGKGPMIGSSNNPRPSIKYTLYFKDGKEAEMDIFADKATKFDELCKYSRAANVKCCLTCKNWCGQREENGSLVETISRGENGECAMSDKTNVAKSSACAGEDCKEYNPL